METRSYSMNGFTFDGWYDNDQYTGRKYTSIEADATGNKKFYARWKDTQAPTLGGTWRYGGSYGSWYSTPAIGLAFSDNTEIDVDSMKVQLDGGAYD